jgi:hypothetical protein
VKSDAISVPAARSSASVYPVIQHAAPSESPIQPVFEPFKRLHKGLRHPKVYNDGIVRYGLLTSTENLEFSMNLLMTVIGWKLWRKNIGP